MNNEKINLSEVSDDELIAELHNRTGKGQIIAVKVWQVDDIGADLPGFSRTLTDDECKQVARFTGTFSALEDCTDDDWYSLADTVSDACKSLGIDAFE